MLSVNTYPQEYVDSCRASVAVQIAAYKDLNAVATDLTGKGRARLESAIDAFERPFFNTMVIALDACFCHRSRTLERKDGNPLNEVRVLCNSILHNDAMLAADKAIKLNPATSVLHLRTGDPIRLDEPAFSMLADAFFAEIESTYPA